MLLLAALLVGSLWVVSLFWDTHRSAAAAVVALVYALAGGGLVAWLLAQLRAAPPCCRRRSPNSSRTATRCVARPGRPHDARTSRGSGAAPRGAGARAPRCSGFRSRRRSARCAPARSTRRPSRGLALRLASSWAGSPERQGTRTPGARARPWMLSAGWLLVRALRASPTRAVAGRRRRRRALRSGGSCRRCARPKPGTTTAVDAAP